MLAEALAIGGLGMVAAFGLGVAAKVFYVEIDPLIEAVEEALPGANCGGCGFAGCSSAAIAISKGKAEANICVGGGPEVTQEIAFILGVEIKKIDPQIAKVGCRYSVDRSDLKYNYSGFKDCNAAMLFANGSKECSIGCVGLGSCKDVCPFEALTMGIDGLPIVDEEKCTGCGTCVRTCPSGIMKLTSFSDRVLKEQEKGECIAPCQRACPAGIDIPKQIYYTALGNWEKALSIIKERNPFPSVCGYICPHPCESACRRNLIDNPVAINPLKRILVERECELEKKVKLYKAPFSENKIAVIGGGVEGLSVSYFLSRLGHSPEIFEKNNTLGGILQTIIPKERLPQKALNWDIESILDLGIPVHFNKDFCTDINISDLFEKNYKAVVVATGGWDSSLLGQKDLESAPIMPNYHLMLPFRMTYTNQKKLKNIVVIIGGNKESLLLARDLINKCGVKKLFVIFSLGPKDLDIESNYLEKYSTENPNIHLYFNSTISELFGVNNLFKRLTVMGKTIHRGINKEIKENIEFDNLIVTGPRFPKMIIVPYKNEKNSEDCEWKVLLSYSISKDLSGDNILEDFGLISDHRTVVEAVASGRRMASSFQQYLVEGNIETPKLMLTKKDKLQGVDELNNLLEVPPLHDFPRFDKPINVFKQKYTELNEKTAKTEARRCLDCGLICYRRTKYN